MMKKMIKKYVRNASSFFVINFRRHQLRSLVKLDNLSCVQTKEI